MATATGPSSADEYLAEVLAVVERVPPGRATTYGLVAEAVAEVLGRGGPRQVGQVMARAGGGLPWWRVVNAAGSPPAHHLDEALTELRAEGCPMTRDGRRVDLRRAVWLP
ncbi:MULTISPECIES: MGMT family protein [unclassified Isoptericola]|uniref:MGMT family protein n=1 Tax=unclassified Isoptericola TaxID=2623355 RepID=UPI0027126CA1|nr:MULTISPECIES: MGMT family protein [unclassified Isoptericola]MDO8144478.1 MGMT family protein [Isoptericola sp. 178]MDO8148331.1 MGMT family protein [Isoptericola sp. b515]MDO8151812.1 MGMT family protein [Isoptericola sp. b408]